MLLGQIVVALFGREYLDWVALATAALIGIFAVVRSIRGFWRKNVRPAWRSAKRDLIAIRDTLIGRGPVLDSITGEEIAAALPSIGVRQAETAKAIEAVLGMLHAIEHEVSFNDGSSIKDATKRIEERLAQGDLEFAAIKSALARDEGRLDRFEDILRTFAESQGLVWSAIEAAINARPADTPN